MKGSRSIKASRKRAPLNTNESTPAPPISTAVGSPITKLGQAAKESWVELIRSLKAREKLSEDEVSNLTLASVLEQLAEQLAAAADDAQLANVELQSALQKQQQTLQMVSSISKALNDTALAVIRKLGS